MNYDRPNVSLNVKKGEMVGIIGHNGSGKSTLLKIICGVLNPSSGAIKTKGKIVPFLQLGQSFITYPPFYFQNA